MIADALRAEIESYAARMRKSNPLFVHAEDGSLSVPTVARYLANVHYLIRHTPIYLERARERSVAQNDDLLARHFEEKLDEEEGHDQWVEGDRARLSQEVGGRVSASVTVAMQELVTYLAEIIDEDPKLYLSYILFAEYLIVLLGPEWLTLLETRCGIPQSSMTVIAKHAELDREHTEEALDKIDDLVADPTMLPRMRQVLLASIEHFETFCAEVTRPEIDECHLEQVHAA